MPEAFLIVGVFVLAAVSTALLVVVRRRTGGTNRAGGELAGKLQARLDETHPTERTHLDTPPRVRRLEVADRTRAGEPIYVPVVRIDFETVEPPGQELAFEFVAGVLEAIHPVLSTADVEVAHYDVEFTFGPDGLLVSRLCQRISVTPALADRLCEEPSFRPRDLRLAVKRADDGTSPAPAAWRECRSS